MGVVEQETEAAGAAQPQQRLEQGGVLGGRPLVEDDHVHPVQLGAQGPLELVRRLPGVESHVDEGEAAAELDQRAQAGAGDEVGHRPAGGLLVADRPVAQACQGAHEAAEDVGVALVPV